MFMMKQGTPTVSCRLHIKQDISTNRTRNLGVWSALSTTCINADNPVIGTEYSSSHEATVHTVSLSGRVTSISDRSPHLEWVEQEHLALDYTHRVKEIIEIWNNDVSRCCAHAEPDDILINAPVVRLFSLYRMWQSNDLRTMARAHEIPFEVKDNRSILRQRLLDHVCESHCPTLVCMFTTLRAPRTTQQIHDSQMAFERVERAAGTADVSFMQIADAALQDAIVRDWQRTMSTAEFNRVVCASCARVVREADSKRIHASSVDLTLLRNDSLPEKVLPRDYAFHLYSRALLCPEGLGQRWSLSEMTLCTVCYRELVEKTRMPKLCLANWLYYGHSALPDEVKHAFQRSTQFDRLLVSRARASKISYRFTQLRQKEKYEGIYWTKKRHFV